jgi:hypothetical protein
MSKAYRKMSGTSTRPSSSRRRTPTLRSSSRIRVPSSGRPSGSVGRGADRRSIASSLVTGTDRPRNPSSRTAAGVSSFTSSTRSRDVCLSASSSSAPPNTGPRSADLPRRSASSAANPTRESMARGVVVRFASASRENIQTWVEPLMTPRPIVRPASFVANARCPASPSGPTAQPSSPRFDRSSPGVPSSHSRVTAPSGPLITWRRTTRYRSPADHSSLSERLRSFDASAKPSSAASSRSSRRKTFPRSWPYLSPRVSHRASNAAIALRRAPGMKGPIRSRLSYVATTVRPAPSSVRSTLSSAALTAPIRASASGSQAATSAAGVRNISATGSGG